MGAAEIIEQQAKSDLTLCATDGRIDLRVWEHAERVARSAFGIVDLVGEIMSSSDRETLLAAALYQDVAWVVLHDQGSIPIAEILVKPLTAIQRETSISTVEKSLKGFIPARRLKSVCRVIREVGRRKTTNITAQLVAEATNLDQIGPLALCQLIRRHVQEGRTLQEMIETWNRQQEYNFWPALISESLRFEPVKRLAQQRLEAMDRFMNSLKSHVRGEDLKNAASQAQSKTPQLI